MNLLERILPNASPLPVEDVDVSPSLRQDPVPPNCRKYFSRLDILVASFPEHDFPNGRSLYPLSPEEIVQIPSQMKARLQQNGRDLSNVKVIACSRKDIEMSVGFEVENRVRILFDIHQTKFVPQVIEDEFFNGRWGIFTYRAPIAWPVFEEVLSFAELLRRPGAPQKDGLPGPKV